MSWDPDLRVRVRSAGIQTRRLDLRLGFESASPQPCICRDPRRGGIWRPHTSRPASLRHSPVSPRLSGSDLIRGSWMRLDCSWREGRTCSLRRDLGRLQVIKRGATRTASGSLCLLCSTSLRVGGGRGVWSLKGLCPPIPRAVTHDPSSCAPRSREL